MKRKSYSRPGRPPKKEKLVKITFEVPPDVKEKLKIIARKMEMPLSGFLRKNIEAFLAVAECGKARDKK